MSAKDRYAFVPFADSGLLLDVESGGLFRLNATAAFVWRRFLDDLDADTIASAIADHHGIDLARARADVAAALAPGALPESAAPEDYQFRRTTAGYVQLHRGRPQLQLDATGAELALLTPASEWRPRHLGNSLRAIVPKILSLRGHTVIHASAVLARSQLLVFSGRSGTGKTTTARALVGEGATLVSEDKLLVRTDAGGSIAWRGAEPYMNAWMIQATVSILADGRVSCAGLDESARGEELPIAEIGFLDDLTPRHAGDIVSRRLSVPDAAAAAFRGMFLGTELPDAWRRQLGAAATLAEQVPSYALTMPDGLAALARAAEVLARRGTLAA